MKESYKNAGIFTALRCNIAEFVDDPAAPSDEPNGNDFLQK